MNFNNFKKIVLVVLAIIVLFMISFFLGTFSAEKKEDNVPVQNKESGSQDCLVEKEIMVVQGSSLFPLIDSGQEVEVFFGYYDCHEIERGDVVLVNYTGNENFLIKIARGLPGDKFELIEKSSEWNIFINGKVLRNSENEEYLINSRQYQMLSLYEKDYENMIPESTYLILGNKTSGSVDSTQFGLVSKENLVAKVVY
jgi:signal peptidase I